MKAIWIVMSMMCGIGGLCLYEDSGADRTVIPLTEINKEQSGEIEQKSEAAANPFFFEEDVNTATYDGKFCFDEMMQGEVKLEVHQMASFKDGALYELRLEDTNGIPSERLSLGYIYVQEDKIYKIEGTKEDAKAFMSSQEAEPIQEATQEKVVSANLPAEMLEGSTIICQEEEMKDELGAEEVGWHHWITVDGEKRGYHSYNNAVETGYYESFIWEKGKGLIGYRSGFGAERDAMELVIHQ